MSDNRPDPDALLSRLASEEEVNSRGRLKVFFGANAGVGKTYAMLEAAQALRREGQLPLVGVIETHGRTETAALLTGLEVLPRKPIEHRGITLHEFDLDAAIARGPKLILLDELAHTNAPGSRHEKRWQDVLELLTAGIDVYTTVNVQHLESLNDVVQEITGIKVRETVPDQILEQADEIVLMDLPPQVLLQRLREGKVYTGVQAARAAENFFKTGNLLALRELALRFVAKRVNVAVQVYRDAEAVRKTWATQERLLVAVGPSPTSAKLIRATRRMATSTGAEWIAISVSTPQSHGASGAKERVAQNLRLAESLGAEVVTTSGTDVARTILDYARNRNVTRIIAGKPVQPRWRELLMPSPVDRLIRESADIDVFVIQGDGEAQDTPHSKPRQSSDTRPHLVALLCIVASSAVAWMMYPFFALPDLIMVYLVGITVTALLASRGATFLASALGVVAFNILFVPPRFTLHVESPQYLLTFAVMFAVGLFISSLTLRLRQHVTMARESEKRTALLHRLSRRLAAVRGSAKILGATLEEAAGSLDSEAIAFLPDHTGKATFLTGHPVELPPSEKETAVAQWVLDNARLAGAGTGTLSSAILVHVPVRIANNPPLAVIGIMPPKGQATLLPDQLELLTSLCGQAALALEVDRLEERHRIAELEAETERLRSSVLSTISHDLRTPVASIQGCAESLLESGAALTEDTRRELIHTISDESQRIGSMIANLLDMTRLEGGGIHLNLASIPVDEIIGAALATMETRLKGRQIRVEIAPDLPFVSVDEILMQHVLLNLLENALKYSPEGSRIQIIARRTESDIMLEVSDKGPGIAPGEESLIFEKFHRGQAGTKVGGVGLGLAICKSIISAHDGKITARNNEEGGSSFLFTLPAQARLALPEEDVE